MKRREFLAAGMGLAMGGMLGGVRAHAQAMAPRTRVRHSTLSNVIGELAPSYDTVVIGSGYGASVIAARLATPSGHLCVLERGREWQPGEFPTTGLQMAQSLRRSGNPLGLVDFSSPYGSDVDIISANGLGGTSLINAAIAIRPLDNVFFEKEWPQEIQESVRKGELARYYDLAESVLKPTALGRIGAQAKTKALRQTALAEGRTHGELRLNIRPESFSAGPNEFGVEQGPCVQCGDCCSGCNFGAKNILTTNYLAIAKRNGAKIFTQCEVDRIEKTHQGYNIYVTYHGPRETKRLLVRAKKVFLGAGAKGSTEILIHSQSDDFRFSEALGTRLSANGDVMGLAYNTRFQTQILGMGSQPENISLSRQPGPIIASYADYRSPSLEGDVQSQFLLLDGVVPSPFRDGVAKGLALYAIQQGQLTDSGQTRRIVNDLQSGPTENGALNHSMLFFACGHDSSGGRFRYSRKNKNNIRYDWPGVTEESTFLRINSIMEKYAREMGGVFVPNPRSTVFGGRKIQATHPLGGCPMGTNAQTGVVDHLGRVFNTQGGLHDQLYVVDAAIIPRSLAATPLMTISALAERIAAHVK